MKKKTVFFVFIFLIFLVLINAVISQQNSVPQGTPSPSVGSGIDSSTGLPIDVLPVKNIGDTLSDEDKRTAYLKAEWQKILEKSEIFGPWIKYLEKLNPVSNILLGMPIAFSWYFFLTLVIWITLLIISYRITKEVHIILTILMFIAITYFKYSKDIAGFIIGIVALMNVWWMQYVIIGIVILAIILAAYFSKQIDLIWKWIKEKHEKNMEGFEKKEFKKDTEALKGLKKTITR